MTNLKLILESQKSDNPASYILHMASKPSDNPHSPMAAAYAEFLDSLYPMFIYESKIGETRKDELFGIAHSLEEANERLHAKLLQVATAYNQAQTDCTELPLEDRTEYATEEVAI